jgi:hypothetical protein
MGVDREDNFYVAHYSVNADGSDKLTGAIDGLK